MFFAPDQMRKRIGEWGRAGLDERFAEAWRTFAPVVEDWVDVVVQHGPDALERTWHEVQSGRADPRVGHGLALLTRGQAAGRAVPVALVVADQADPPHVPLVLAERRAEELEHQLGRLLRAVLPGADGDDVGVVVLAGQLRRRGVPHQGGPDAGHLVGRDLLAVARSHR